MRPFLVMAVLLCYVLPTTLQAAVVTGLYEVRVPLATQASQARNAAFNTALDVLRTRLTGQPENPRPVALAKMYQDPQQLISQFSIEGNSLVVDFDPAAVRSGFMQAGLSIWGQERPLLLVWWLEQTPEGQRLVGDGQESAALLKAAAQHRGLPISLPLADLEEQLAATREQLLSEQADTLQNLSQRYTPDIILTVVANQAADQSWQAQWHAWSGADLTQGQLQAADTAALADALMRQLAMQYTPKFVQTPGAVTQLTLIVEANDLERMARLGRLLVPFAGRLLQAQGEQLTYQVQADPEQLRAQLIQNQLQELPASTASVTAELPAPAPAAQPTVLRFSW